MDTILTNAGMLICHGACAGVKQIKFHSKLNALPQHQCDVRAILIKRCCLTSGRFPIIKIRQSYHHLIFVIRIHTAEEMAFILKEDPYAYICSQRPRSSCVPWFIVTTQQRPWQAYLTRKLPHWSHSQTHLRKEQCKNYRNPANYQAFVCGWRVLIKCVLFLLK